MRRSTDHPEPGVPTRGKVAGYVVALALLLSAGNTVFTVANQIELNRVQSRDRAEGAALQLDRFKAETRACRTSQNIVQGERRVIKRSMNAQRRAGLLNRERLNFYKATLRDLKVPSCSPTAVGFPQFEPPK